MPCFNMFNKCPEGKVRSRFAWTPLTDVDGKTIWFRRYWEFGEWWEFGFYVLRGARKEFPCKQMFWDYIKYRVAVMY